ncbi:MAG: 3-hydroxylacyl-ACP dehydratase [Spirochaetales bacterium]|nr:3-hydroxylacyl-ACP dehydratase [Spirochaetales bacterium]
MNQRIERDELINLLPHKGKMFLLSRVTKHDIEKFSITVETDVTEDFIFYEEELGGIPNWCTFEIMAQGISALTGIYDKVHGIESKAGCIVSISSFKSDRDVFKIGTTVKATAVEEYRDEESGIYRYQCAAFDSPESLEPVVTATVTVMKVENLESLAGV